jgi:hypothetical protein
VEGLKEITIFNRKHQTPSFVGISNWDIDASKLNRNLYLARPDLTKKDLLETAKIIIQYHIKNEDKTGKITKEVDELSEGFSEAYIKFRSSQKVSYLKKVNKRKIVSIRTSIH